MIPDHEICEMKKNLFFHKTKNDILSRANVKIEDQSSFFGKISWSGITDLYKKQHTFFLEKTRLFAEIQNFFHENS